MVSNTYPFGFPTDSTVAYLSRLTGGAPIEVFTKQPLYLASPLSGIRLRYPEDDGITLQAKAVAGGSYFNTATGLPEYDVLMVLTHDAFTLSDAYRLRPYIALAVDGARSRSARTFLKSITDALIEDSFALTYTLSWADVSSPLAKAFNPNAGDDAAWA